MRYESRFSWQHRFFHRTCILFAKFEQQTVCFSSDYENLIQMKLQRLTLHQYFSMYKIHQNIYYLRWKVYDRHLSCGCNFSLMDYGAVTYYFLYLLIYIIQMVYDGKSVYMCSFLP